MNTPSILEIAQYVSTIPTDLFCKLVQRGTNTWSDAPPSIRALEDMCNSLSKPGAYIPVSPERSEEIVQEGNRKAEIIKVDVSPSNAILFALIQELKTGQHKHWDEIVTNDKVNTAHIGDLYQKLIELQNIVASLQRQMLELK